LASILFAIIPKNIATPTRCWRRPFLLSTWKRRNTP